MRHSEQMLQTYPAVEVYAHGSRQATGEYLTTLLTEYILGYILDVVLGVQRVIVIAEHGEG